MIMTGIKRTNLMIPNKLNDSEPQVLNDVYSSYIFSTSSRSLSKYGERLLMEVINVAHEYTVDAALGFNKLDFGEKYKQKFATIDIPIKNLLDADDTTNYSKAKEASVELMKIYHTVEAPVLDEYGNPKTYKDGTPQYQFASFHLLDRVTVNQKPGIVSVTLGEDTWSQILDMGKGYTRYNLQTAKSLDNVVAIRLFQILSNTREDLYFTIERIKAILGLQGKYESNATGFIRRVIVPAEAEINEKCPFEVVHELSYDNTNRGRPTLVGLIFKKINKPAIMGAGIDFLDSELVDILKNSFNFDKMGIRNNLPLFLKLINAKVDLIGFLQQIEEKANMANSPQAYVIASLKNLLRYTLLSPSSQKRRIPGSENVIPDSVDNQHGKLMIGLPKKRVRNEMSENHDGVKSRPLRPENNISDSKQLNSYAATPAKSRGTRLSVDPGINYIEENSGFEEI